MKNFAVGDKVRSYDFPHATDCYIEGEIVAINFGRYAIKVEKTVIGDALRPNNVDMVYAPLNGLDSFFGETNGVVKI